MRKRLPSRAAGQSGSTSQQISPVTSTNKNRNSQQSSTQNTPIQENNGNILRLQQQKIEDIKLETSPSTNLETKPAAPVAIPEPENSLNNERKRKERLASKLQMTKQQQIQSNGIQSTGQLLNSHKVIFLLYLNITDFFFLKKKKMCGHIKFVA